MTRILLPFVTCLLLMLPASSYSQQCTRPFTKEGLLSSLRKKEIRKGDLQFVAEQMQSCGVDFNLTIADEQEIRQRGKYLGEEGLNKLIAAVRQSYRVPEPVLRGLLIPANDPTPPNPCLGAPFEISPKAVFIFFGNSAAFTDRLRITAIRFVGKDLISLSRTPDGLNVSAQVFSEDGRIIAEIEDNEFHVNPNNYFKVKRPDESTLIVYDQQNNPVLNVRYLNPSAIKILGVFHSPNREPVVIEEEKLILPGMGGVYRSCMGYFSEAAIWLD
ncbi:MAG TPA: hypothetical protein VGC87_03430 [Pyrinomonadaceae bacterium]|jgi:hypothetical protein